MQYKFFPRWSLAQLELDKVKQEGYKGYIQKLNADTWELRFW